MVTSIFCLTHVDQQILITIEKQDILALEERDTLPWGLQEVSHLINSTKQLRYQVFFLILYSLGLRLGEGLDLAVGDIDSHRTFA
ncbi:hypothetical protein AYY24_11615 [Photobacterium phosphoreum]|nr:hypothetical protein AYY24_11615 [Photobacterium phosphoreum]